MMKVSVEIMLVLPAHWQTHRMTNYLLLCELLFCIAPLLYTWSNNASPHFLVCVSASKCVTEVYPGGYGENKPFDL